MLAYCMSSIANRKLIANCPSIAKAAAEEAPDFAMEGAPK
jgi:hypothetical protein